MTFASPAFLLLLLPVAVVGIYLMSRGGAVVEVPSTRFWSIDSPRTGARWRWGGLPAWVWLALASAALAVTAAAGPLIGGRWVRPVTLIVDRGVTMSAGDSDDATTRLRSVFESLSTAQARAGIAPLRVVLVPGGAVDVGGGSDTPGERDWREISAEPPTAVDTRQALRAAVRDEFTAGDRPVVVATDQPIEAEPGRLGVIPPVHSRSPGGNVGIVAIGAAASPPRLLIRLRASTDVQSVALHAGSAGATIRHTVDRLAAGEEREVILDLPQLGDVVEARVVAPGDVLPADDTAWLVRAWSWPKIEARSAIGRDLARFVEVYAQQRSTDPDAPVVEISSPAPPAGRGVWVRPPGDGSVLTGDGEARVTGGIGQELDWREILQDARIGPEPDASWRPIVAVGGRTLLAERTAPERQVLVNFASPALARRADFVVLFGQIFDSFADGAGRAPGWSSAAMIEPPPGWVLTTPPVPGLSASPGVYRDSAGRLHALNVGDVRLPTAGDGDWIVPLSSLPAAHVAGRSMALAVTALAGVLLVASVTLGVARRGVAA